MNSNLMIKAGLRTTFATLTVASLAIPASATTITFENLDIDPFTGSIDLTICLGLSPSALQSEGLSYIDKASQMGAFLIKIMIVF